MPSVIILFSVSSTTNPHGFSRMHTIATVFFFKPQIYTHFLECLPEGIKCEFVIIRGLQSANAIPQSVLIKES